MRKLATIRVIDEVQPIEGADRIEKVRLGGWWCVTKKDEFKVNDPCVYFEIDSLLPVKEQFQFLESRGRKKSLLDGVEHEGYRLRTVKLKGVVSQGLALPLSQFPGITPEIDADVTDFIGVLKFEPPVPACLAGEAEGSFPGFIPKTDEERIQNVPELLTQYKTNRFLITEKVDGTSSTFFKFEGNFGVCGRNMRWRDTEANLYWRIAKRYDLQNKLPEGYALQGEIIGESIQKNPLKQTGQDCLVFYVIEINKNRYLPWPEMIQFVGGLGMRTVPLVDDNFIIGDRTMKDILSMADSKSLLNPREDREGLVFRLFDSTEKITFKAISNKYLLTEV